MRIEDDNGISGLLIGEETRLCGGFGFIEGPIWIASDIAAGGALVFSDIPGNRQHIWRPGDSEAGGLPRALGMVERAHPRRCRQPARL